MPQRVRAVIAEMFESATAPWAVVKWMGSLMATAWISIPAAAQVLVVLMGIDYLSGVISASMRKELSAEIGWQGLKRKTLTLLLVFTAHYLVRQLEMPLHFAAMIAVAFSVNEGISIVKNCDDAGVPIPASLVELLLRAKSVTGRTRVRRQLRKAIGEE